MKSGYFFIPGTKLGKMDQRFKYKAKPFNNRGLNL